MLIINADDWGNTTDATDNCLACHTGHRITSVSAMVFMKDSERAADLAREHRIDAGLHLNFTAPFTAPVKHASVRESQFRIASFLRKKKYNFLLYNLRLRNDFRSCFNAQYEEYARLYKQAPSHFDGHHHMHLCTNVLLDDLVPADAVVRRNFSFARGEKSFANRLYRSCVDAWLRRRYVCTDFFFSIAPVGDRDRLRRIVDLSLSNVVELMVHPHRQEEYDYLMSDEFREAMRGAPLGTHAAVSQSAEHRTPTGRE